MMFGALAATLFCLQILIKLFFKKIFTTNNEFLLNNQIYHCFWVLGSYISIILATCALLYIIHITGEGLEWLYYKYWK